MMVPPLFPVVANLTDFLPVAVGLFALPRLKTDTKILLILFFLMAAIDTITFLCVLQGIDYEWIHYIYTPFEYGLFIWALSLWQEKHSVRLIFRLSILPFAILCGLNIYLQDNLFNVNGFAESVALLIYMIAAAYTIYNLQKNDMGSIWNDYRIWFCATILLSSAGNLVEFTTMLIAFSIQLWQFHLILTMLSNILFAGGFICLYRHWKSPGLLSQLQ